MRPAMDTPTSQLKPSWQAEIKWKRRFYTVTEEVPAADEPGGRSAGARRRARAAAPRAKFRALRVEIIQTPEKQIVNTLHSVMECFVDVFNARGDRISFRVNMGDGRDLTFTDPRDKLAGRAGLRGIWGTLPEPPPNPPRPLTPTDFKDVDARLIGPERAEQIVKEILTGDFFAPANAKCSTPRTPASRSPSPQRGRG
jgi:hypothetical protein